MRSITIKKPRTRVRSTTLNLGSSMLFFLVAPIVTSNSSKFNQIVEY